MRVRRVPLFPLVRFVLLPWLIAAPIVALPVQADGSSDIVINEVLYDPEGSDTGLEFVEIMNCGREGVLLTGWIVETGNGAQSGDWTTEWIGGDFDYLEPGGLFLIGESSVVPSPDYVAALDLQNGPDGVRLTDGEEVIDVVGWGEPLFAEYYEGTPTADVASGMSVARSPDCIDRDDNAADFVAACPTPGARNSHLHDLAVRVSPSGEHVFPSGGPVDVACVVVNVGAASTGETVAVSHLIVEPLGVVESRVLDVILEPRDSAAVTLSWNAPPPGYHRASAVLEYGPDADLSNNESATTFSVGGPGGLVAVNEIMYSPAEGGTEWIELVSLEADSIDLGGWSLGDPEETHAVSPDSGVTLAPGAFLVVAADRSLVEAPAPVVETARWEALSADDVVVVRDRCGTPMADLVYTDDWGGDRGVSLERVRADMAEADPNNWGSSVAPGGATPGRPNSIHIARLPSAGTLTLAPNPFSPDGDGRADRTSISIELPVAQAIARLTVFDLKGRRRAILLDRTEVASETEVLWDGRDGNGERLPAGLYVVTLEAINARAGVYATAKTSVGIVR